MKHPMPSVIWRILNFRNRLSGSNARVQVPMRILSDFNVHYVCYSENGLVCYGAKTFHEALDVRRQTGQYFTRVFD